MTIVQRGVCRMESHKLRATVAFFDKIGQFNIIDTSSNLGSDTRFSQRITVLEHHGSNVCTKPYFALTEHKP